MRFRSVFTLSLLVTSSVNAQFDAAQLVYPGGSSVKLNAADLDGDGALDLVGTFNGNHLKWIPNADGNGAFGPSIDIATFGDDIGLFVVADVDQDTDMDLLVVRYNHSSVDLLRNNGDGTFAPLEMLVDLGSSPSALTVADLNGDGFQDVVVSHGSGDDAGFAWLPGSAIGFGTLIEVLDLYVGAPSTMLATGDLDLIAGTDIVLRADNDALLFVRNVNGDASLWTVEPLPIPDGQPTYPYNTPQLLDADGDGDLDLAESRGSAVHWLENMLNEGGVLNFHEHLIEPWTTSGNGMFSRSPCGSGTAVVYAPGNPTLPVRWNTFVPLLNDFPQSNDLPMVPRGTGILLADLDNDNKDDLVMKLPNGVYWFRNNLVPSTTELLLPTLDTLCLGGPAVDLPSATPAGGSWYGTQVSGSLLFRSNITSSGFLPLTHVVYPTESCPLADTTRIRLITAPVILNTVPSVICSDQSPIQMTSSPVDVAWYGLDGSSILDPAVFAGGYVRCEYADGTGRVCSSLQGPIQRWNSLPAEIAPAGPFCEDDTVQVITASAIPPFGSSWGGPISGSQGTTAYFDPSIGAGEYEVVLYANPFAPNQCPNSDTLIITVSARPEITFSPIPAYCVSSGAVTLTGAMPADGFWSGTGVSNGMLDPAVVGPGVHLVSYFVTSPEGCGRLAATTVELADAAAIGWTVDDLVICTGDDPVMFTASPAGGTWSEPIGQDGVFDPDHQSVGLHPIAYSYTDPLGCELAIDTLELDLRMTSVITMDSVGVLCSNGGQPVDLVGSAPGSWSGAVEGQGGSIEFDPAMLGAGTWTVTLTATVVEGCPGSVSQDIVVEICTGIKDETRSAPTLAPNPFNNDTRLSLIGSDKALLQVFDATGRIVRSSTHSVNGPSVIDLDLSGQRAGAYTVRIQLDGRTWNVRALKLD